jgi:16S rRNA (adenine1518-N6/adenine1519-N6)-dimethyltransferase
LDKVLEVGPGLGPLTELLLEKAGEVLAIEKDRRFFDFVSEKLKDAPRLTLLHDDALRYVEKNREWADWKLVANLPYSVASPLLVELAQSEHPPERMVVTLQLEVARRIEAGPGTKQYGILGLLLRLRYEVGASFKIPGSCFFPEPDVESACIILVRRAEPLLPPGLEPVFTKIVKRGFSQRRKMMMKLLKQDWPADKLTDAFAELKISPQERAEKLSLEQFVQLTEYLDNMSEEIFDVVNDRDEVVGQNTRRIVHRDGHRHRAVHVLVFGSDGRIFLQKRSMTKDTFPGAWDSSASGHVDTGEDYDACAVRELREELGLTVPAAPRRLFKVAACLETGQEFVWVYQLESDGPFTLHPEEIERGDWFGRGEVTDWIEKKPRDFSSGFVLIWKSLTAGGAFLNLSSSRSGKSTTLGDNK